MPDPESFNNGESVMRSITTKLARVQRTLDQLEALYPDFVERLEALKMHINECQTEIEKYDIEMTQAAQRDELSDEKANEIAAWMQDALGIFEGLLAERAIGEADKIGIDQMIIELTRARAELLKLTPTDRMH